MLNLSKIFHFGSVPSKFRTYFVSRHFLQNETKLPDPEAIKEKWKNISYGLMKTPAEKAYKVAKLGNVKDDGTTKRFYQLVTINQNKGQWEVLLDGRQLRTPSENHLLLPTPELAYAIAGEWDSQQDDVEPRRMPILRLATTALDVAYLQPHLFVYALMDYLEHDSVCYKFSEGFETITGLAQEQEKHQKELINWFQGKFKTRLGRSKSFTLVQPPETSAAIEVLLRGLDYWTLTGLESIASEAKSLVVALAVWHKFLTADNAFEFSYLEETYQQKAYGVLEGTHDIQALDIQVRIAAASVFLKTLPNDAITI